MSTREEMMHLEEHLHQATSNKVRLKPDVEYQDSCYVSALAK